MSAANYRNQPRRRFSRDFKREVVEILLEQAATVAEVARAYDLHPNQLCRWRTEYFRGKYDGRGQTAVQALTFLPVEIAEPVDTARMLQPDERRENTEAGASPRIARLKIVLAKGQIHLEDIEPETLGILIEALR